MAFSAGSFIIPYNPGDRVLNLKDVNNIKIGGFNVCHYQKGITEGKELWITTPEVILVLDFATDVEAKQALNILETTIESLAPNCPTGSGGGITSLGGQTGASQTFANDTNVHISSSANVHTLNWAGLLAANRGGTGIGIYTPGDLLVGNSFGNLSKLSIGSNGQVLTLVAGLPIWQTPSGSSLTIATEAEAAAGTENTHYMSPVRTRQAAQEGAFLQVFASPTAPNVYAGTPNGGLDTLKGVIFEVLFDPNQPFPTTGATLNIAGTGAHPIKKINPNGIFAYIDITSDDLAIYEEVRLGFDSIQNVYVIAQRGTETTRMSKNIYVDATFGNDTTGIKYRVNNPFATIAAAETVAADGDTIYLLPGNYNPVISLLQSLPLLVTTINYYACAGATITGSPVITDNGVGDKIIKVSGFGRWIGGISLINNSTIDFHAMSASSSVGINNGLVHSFTVIEDFVSSGGSRLFNFRDNVGAGLRVDIRARRIKGFGDASLLVEYADPSTDGVKINVYADIENPGTSNLAPTIGFAGSGMAVGIINVYGNIYRDNGAGTAPCIGNLGSNTNTTINIFGDVFDSNICGSVEQGYCFRPSVGSINIYGNVTAQKGVFFRNTNLGTKLNLYGNLTTLFANLPSIDGYDFSASEMLVKGDVVNTDSVGANAYCIYLNQSALQTPTVRLAPTARLITNNPAIEAIFATATRSIKVYPGASTNSTITAGINANIVQQISILTSDSNV